MNLKGLLTRSKESTHLTSSAVVDAVNYETAREFISKLKGTSGPGIHKSTRPLKPGAIVPVTSLSSYSKPLTSRYEEGPSKLWDSGATDTTSNGIASLISNLQSRLEIREFRDYDIPTMCTHVIVSVTDKKTGRRTLLCDHSLDDSRGTISSNEREMKLMIKERLQKFIRTEYAYEISHASGDTRHTGEGRGEDRASYPYRDVHRS